MIDWPATLPQDVEIPEYSNPFGDRTIRSEMESGPSFARPRSTVGVDPATWRIELTRAQVDILEDFYKNTLAGGSLRFNFLHPRLLTTVEVRFTKAPDPKPLPGGTTWGCPLNLEVLP